VVVQFGHHLLPNNLGNIRIRIRMHRNSAVLPVVVALITAVVGQAAILANDFGPGNQPHAGMVTAAAVARVGAIEIPVEPGNHSSGNGMIKPAPVARVGAIEIPVGPGNHLHGSVTATPVARVGAIEIPTGP
jgi:hypothetical protein